MALKLPPNFQSHIQSRDTNLVPVVVLEGLVSDIWEAKTRILISTGITTVETPVNYEEQLVVTRERTTLPLLLKTAYPLKSSLPTLRPVLDIAWIFVP